MVVARQEVRRELIRHNEDDVRSGHYGCIATMTVVHNRRVNLDGLACEYTVERRRGVKVLLDVSTSGWTPGDRTMFARSLALLLVPTLLVLTGASSMSSPAVAGDELPPGGTFVDDDGLSHEPNIEAIAAAGITAGCDDTHYCPNAPVSRAQMGSFLSRALDLSIPSNNQFSDVSGTHLGAINAIADAGISLGCDADAPCTALRIWSRANRWPPSLPGP